MMLTYDPCLDQIELKIIPAFKPEMVLGLKWAQLSNGNFYSVDRGADNDIYAGTIETYGDEDYINSIINAIEHNREADDHELILSGFSTTEKIFGADVDYSGSITGTIDTMEAMRRVQGSWRGWGLSLRIVALSPQFSSVSPALPPLRLIDIGVDADSDRTLGKSSSYDNTFSYDDREADYGQFTGVFTFTDTEMCALRRFMATNRGGDVTIPELHGIRYPFGRRSAENPENFKVKIIKWQDEKMRDISRWTVKLTMAEVIA